MIELSDRQILDLAIDGGIYDCLSDQYIKADGTLSLDVDLVRFARKLIKAQEDQAAALQATIDALMLEYCPSEMAREQIETWAKHQRPVTDSGGVISRMVEGERSSSKG